ncbi:hypothetical protein GOP47_0023133 [Adiantum capillus-veneris]|uniref:Uncharacterized protein n=1 Tax=Adiantum capillus-veneris TaxID=13818 RepID=A0A9D4U8P1_ADICA|nr:hypothetical protein GOP47_0023133 [Adiantum capillus-veneris]
MHGRGKYGPGLDEERGAKKREPVSWRRVESSQQYLTMAARLRGSEGRLKDVTKGSPSRAATGKKTARGALQVVAGFKRRKVAPIEGPPGHGRAYCEARRASKKPRQLKGEELEEKIREENLVRGLLRRDTKGLPLMEGVTVEEEVMRVPEGSR